MKKTFLSWRSFDEAVAFIAANATEAEPDSVFGFPRGGLPLAVALSHRMGLPLLSMVSPGPRTLLVDDIVETGTTAAPYLAAGHDPRLVWAWVNKNGGVYNAAVHDTAIGWVVFPWERDDADAVERDARDFYDRR